MPLNGNQSRYLTQTQARRIWLHAQRLDSPAPFGSGLAATRAAIEHLGYVQIDTINVIERCHHHILWTRIPSYRRAHLHYAQSVEKSVFEYWTHALSYLPTKDFPFFVAAMKRHRREPRSWFGTVTKAESRKIMSLIRNGGALTIRDIDDDVLEEKRHFWASRKPSKRTLQLAFYSGMLTISQRKGMLKTYDLIERHFGWDTLPSAASKHDTLAYLLDRALRSQGIVSLDSVCHLDAKSKPALRKLIEARVHRRELLRVLIQGAETLDHWIEPAVFESVGNVASERMIHILSPFDPLIIQRKRLELFFNYSHRFEAYVPKQKRLFGYFALPVLVGDNIVAAIDLKADRKKRELLVQKWTWISKGNIKYLKARIEEEMHNFEHFQFAD